MAEKVGDRIAQARRLLAAKLNRDIKQAVIAEMAGFSGAAWSRWETNRNRPGRKVLEQIERLFRKQGLPQVTAGWLDYGEGNGPLVLGTPLPKRVPKPISSKDIADEQDPPDRKKG